MELVRLNQNDWKPYDMIQGYGSLIWTERYTGSGDFILTTKKVADTRKRLPRGSRVGLRDSQEVMTVETHAIAKTDDGDYELTVTGRTFETILEMRSTVIIYEGNGGQNNMLIFEDDEVWPTIAAKGLIMTHLTVCNEAPWLRIENTSCAVLIGGAEHPGEQMSYKYAAGNVYEEVMHLLDMENAGIRNQLDSDGVLKIYIYRGKNRTAGQTERNSVVFNLSADHIDAPTYLWSNRDFRNVAYVVGDAWQQMIYPGGVNHEVYGDNRRILHVDGSSIQAESSVDKKRRQARALGLKALAQQNDRFIFDGEASLTVPYKRGVHYNLGDRVTLTADHDVNQTMIVSEYIRTEDIEGERGYPTLIAPNELEYGGV